MLKRYFVTGLCLLILANTLVLTVIVGQISFFNLREYRSPVRGTDLAVQGRLPPQTDKVVIVLISGLSLTDLTTTEFPVLTQLQRAGAVSAIDSPPRSYALSTWGTLVTGATADLNDAPPLDGIFASSHSISIDTLFRRVRAVGLATAVLGGEAWRDLIPAEQLSQAVFADGNDALLVEAALPLVEAESPQLVLLQLNHLKWTLQQGSDKRSEEYLAAVAQVNRHLGEISQAIDLARTVLIVTADHALLGTGGYGGAELELSQQPLILLGDKIITGEYRSARHADLAPTIAAMLGTSLPTATQGEVLYEMLRLSNLDRTVIQLQLAEQRLDLAEAYNSVLRGRYQPLPEDLVADMARAQSIFAEQNISGTFELATLIQRQADRLMLQTREQVRAQAQQLRLIVSGVVVLLALGALWQLRGPQPLIIVVAAVAVVAVYHGLYRLQGYSYSLSDIGAFAELPWEVWRRMFVSLLVGGTLLLLMLLTFDETDWVVLLTMGYRFSLLVTFLFALPALWAFWQNGLLGDWFLPDAAPLFWQILSTFDLFAVALLGLLAPWPIMIVSRLINRTRQQLLAPEVTPRRGFPMR